MNDPRRWRLYYRTPDGRVEGGGVVSTLDDAEWWVAYGNRVWPAFEHWYAPADAPLPADHPLVVQGMAVVRRMLDRTG